MLMTAVWQVVLVYFVLDFHLARPAQLPVVVAAGDYQEG